MRVLAWFSCGDASAVAAKLAVDAPRDACILRSMTQQLEQAKMRYRLNKGGFVERYERS